MEFFELAGFVFIAGLMAIFLEHPDMPVMKSSLKDHALLRRIPLGIVMGAYITIVILLTGQKSGAHINPSVSWAFFRLGKINFADAFFYTIAQFAGAFAATQVLVYLMHDFFGYPTVNYGNTLPKPPYGAMTAFIAEFIISFILMFLILLASSSKRFEKWVAYLSGVLIAVYLIVELPFSGMSLNPARSFAGAFAASQYRYLWVYFVSPIFAMLAASEIYLKWKKRQLNQLVFAKNAAGRAFTQTDYIEIPNYPIDGKAH